MKIFILSAVATLLFISCSNEENPVTSLKGSIFIGSSPSGAQIWINEENTSQLTPITVKDLAPGNYIVTLKLQNYKDTTFVVEVEEGKLTSVSFLLQVNFGKIYLMSTPWEAQIWRNVINTSHLTPHLFEDVIPGSYSFTLKLQDYKDTTFDVSVSGGQITTVDVALTSIQIVINPGSIFLTSIPSGAEIWLDDVNTSKTTPDSITGVAEGIHNITLKLGEYSDTTFTVNILAGQTILVGPIVLVSNLFTTLYGPVRIYETNGTTANQPAGLDLSTGMTYGVTSTQNGLVDIYYSSDGYLIQSADMIGLIRETDFFVSSGTNLFDGVDSPLRNSGAWTNHFGDSEDNYVFLYDHDSHYSKLIIVNKGGGVPGNPAWVDVQWYYNETALDNHF